MYTPPPRRRSRLLLILVVVVVIIVVIGVVSYVFAPAAPTIQISQINFASPDNVCGLDGATASGFVANTTNVVPLSFDVDGANTSSGSGTLPCNIETVTTTTPGFSITNASVPLAVPANETVILSFNVVCPSSSYSGALDITLT